MTTPPEDTSGRSPRIDRYVLLDLISVHTPSEQFEGYRQFPTELWRGHDEVLELLLEELGIEMPSGTVQRFSAFRRLLLKYAEEDTRVFIVVEDAARIGTDALSELEALTATDAGVSEGANIVLMGDSGVDALLQSPQLARMRQRLRLRQEIAPMSASELLGYCKHCFRLAGNASE